LSGVNGLVLAIWHVRSKDRARKQFLSSNNHLRLAADLCLLFELVAMLWGKRPQNLLFFVYDFVLKRCLSRQDYGCRGGREMSKVAAGATLLISLSSRQGYRSILARQLYRSTFFIESANAMMIDRLILKKMLVGGEFEDQA